MDTTTWILIGVSGIPLALSCCFICIVIRRAFGDQSLIHPDLIEMRQLQQQGPGGGLALNGEPLGLIPNSVGPGEHPIELQPIEGVVMPELDEAVELNEPIANIGATGGNAADAIARAEPVVGNAVGERAAVAIANIGGQSTSVGARLLMELRAMLNLALAGNVIGPSIENTSGHEENVEEARTNVGEALEHAAGVAGVENANEQRVNFRVRDICEGNANAGMPIVIAERPSTEYGNEQRVQDGNEEMEENVDRLRADNIKSETAENADEPRATKVNGRQVENEPREQKYRTQDVDRAKAEKAVGHQTENVDEARAENSVERRAENADSARAENAVEPNAGNEVERRKMNVVETQTENAVEPRSGKAVERQSESFEAARNAWQDEAAPAENPHPQRANDEHGLNARPSSRDQPPMFILINEEARRRRNKIMNVRLSGHMSDSEDDNAFCDRL